MIKQAAESLLKKGSITQQEYDSIDFDKVAAFKFPSILENIAGDPRKRSAISKWILKNPGRLADDAMEHEDIAKEVFESISKEEKKPGIMGKIFNATKGGSWAVVPAAVGAAFVAKEGLVDPAVQAMKVNRSYSEMTANNPQLRMADPAVVRDYFDVIKTYSPHAASNPLVAGALVNKMMEFGGVDHKLIQDISNIQPWQKGNDAMKSMIGGGIKTISKSPKDD